MASAFDKLREQLSSAKAEYKARRRELERQIEELDREYGALFGTATNGAGAKRGPKPRGAGKTAYGGVREAVLGAIKSHKGIKPAGIVEATGLASAQVHNSLTGLKKDKLVKVKDGLYTAS